MKQEFSARSNPETPRPIRKDYRIGQRVKVTKKDKEGNVRLAEAEIIGMDKYKVLTLVWSGQAVYRECYGYFDLMQMGAAR